MISYTSLSLPNPITILSYPHTMDVDDHHYLLDLNIAADNVWPKYKKRRWCSLGRIIVDGPNVAQIFARDVVNQPQSEPSHLALSPTSSVYDDGFIFRMIAGVFTRIGKAAYIPISGSKYLQFISIHVLRINAYILRLPNAYCTSNI